MKLGFDIEAYIPGPRAGLYTVRLQAEPITELDRFLRNPENQGNADFNRLVRYVIGCPRQGYREGRPPDNARFRDEDDLQALSVASPDERPPFPPSLRLFCLRYRDVVILGSGAVKRTRTLDAFCATSAEADRAVRVMRQVRERFEARVHLGEIEILDVSLRGNLSFPPDEIH